MKSYKCNIWLVTVALERLTHVEEPPVHVVVCQQVGTKNYSFGIRGISDWS